MQGLSRQRRWTAVIKRMPVAEHFCMPSARRNRPGAQARGPVLIAFGAGCGWLGW